MDQLKHWLKGETHQNFGDYLSEYIADKIFYRTFRNTSEVRIIGSYLHDAFVPGGNSKPDLGLNRPARLIAWGGGIRERGGLTESQRGQVQILSVRGPVSARDLELSPATPQADPALVLPAIYAARKVEKLRGKTLCIPHFHEKKTDQALLSLSGADLVLRPNIVADHATVEKFIDTICSSDFVLSASLHAIIIAVAYGVPFALWDPGTIDLPVKWQDFCESIGISAEFSKNLNQGRLYYDQVASQIALPDVLGSLRVAPYLVRPEAFAKIILHRAGEVSEKAKKPLEDAITFFSEGKSHFEEIADETLSVSQAMKERVAGLQQEALELQAEKADLIGRSQRSAKEYKALQTDLSSINSALQRIEVVHAETIEELRNLQQKYNRLSETKINRLIRWLKSLKFSIVENLKLMFQRLLVARRATKTSLAGEETKPRLTQAFFALNGEAAIYFPPVTKPVVSIIIPAYRNLGLLQNCLRSISVNRFTEPSFEVIVVDDSPEAPVNWALPNCGGLIKISNEKNVGFLASCNFGATRARGDFLCFLNTDTIVLPGWLSNLIRALEEQPAAGIAGSMLLNDDGTVQNAGWRILSNGWGHPIGVGKNAADGAYTYRRRVDCVTGACFAIPKALFQELGGLDEIYAPAFYEEFDLMFRANALGRHTLYEPGSKVIHLGSASYGDEKRMELSTVNKKKFEERFAEALRKHPWDYRDEFLLRSARNTGPVILVIDLDLPQPDRHAGDITLYGYLTLLADSGWRVIFAPADSYGIGPAAEVLERHGIELVRRPNTIENWLQAHGRHVHEVLIARPEIAVKYIPAIRKYTSAQLSYYTHDLHYLRLEREYEVSKDASVATSAAQAKEREEYIFQEVDSVLSPNGDESDTIRLIAPATKVATIPPYSYGDSDFKSRERRHFENLRDVIYVGGFPHTPNVDAAIYIAQEVMPLVWQKFPDVRLLLIGYAPPKEVQELAGERVVVTGQVPSLGPFFDRARVMLAAMRYGAGVKGKVVEALRLGVPVVTTPIGAEGLSIVSGTHALVGSTAVELAEAVCELLSDSVLCEELSRNGCELARNQFHTRRTAEALKSTFRTKRCSICGSSDLFALDADTPNISEQFVCKTCFGLARTEALSRMVLQRLGKKGESSLAQLPYDLGLQVHEFGFVGGIVDVLNGRRWFSTSDYFDGVAKGQLAPNGIRCEDLAALTFKKATFDLVISQDVLEHVYAPRTAFSEISRVLKPGGAHIFTIPFNAGLAHSVTRAHLDSGKIIHDLTPVYHGDPTRSQGALVFTDFGKDIFEMAEKAGLNLTEHWLPVLGGSHPLRVFEARKPPL